MCASFAQLANRRKMLGDELLYAMDGRSSCKGQSAWWVSIEIDHELARTACAARAAATPALQMCAGCPVLELCDQWAEVEQYTGLAASYAWVNGRRRDPLVPLTQPGAWTPARQAGPTWQAAGIVDETGAGDER